MVEWHDDYYIDDDGRRWAFACAWSPECVGNGVPEGLLRRVADPVERPRVTATVTTPVVDEDRGDRYRVYLESELPTFGSGWQTLWCKVGRKRVRLEDAHGRVRWITLDEFYLLRPEFEMGAKRGVSEEQGHADDVGRTPEGDGGAA